LDQQFDDFDFCFQRAKTSSSDSGVLKNPEVEILKIFK